MKTTRILFLLVITLSLNAYSQRKKNKTSEPTIKLEDSIFQGLKWRNIGPFRGCRSVATTDVVGQPMTYYMGIVGGAIWKTEHDAIINTEMADYNSAFRSLDIPAIIMIEE